MGEDAGAWKLLELLSATGSILSHSQPILVLYQMEGAECSQCPVSKGCTSADSTNGSRDDLKYSAILYMGFSILRVLESICKATEGGLNTTSSLKP